MRDLICILVLIGFSSCASQRETPFEYIPEEIPYGIVGDEHLSLNISFVGLLGTHYVFECVVEVIGSDAITLDQQNFFLQSDNGNMLPIDVQSQIEKIKYDKDTIVKRKKSRTLLGIIGGGLVAALNLAGGAPPVETLLLTTETVGYTIEDNVRDNQVIESQEDYIHYLRNGLFDDDLLLPGQKMSRDVLFPVEVLDGEVVLGAIIDGIEYTVIFDSRHFESTID